MQCTVQHPLRYGFWEYCMSLVKVRRDLQKSNQQESKKAKMIEEEEWSKELEANRKPGQKHPTPSPVRLHARVYVHRYNSSMGVCIVTLYLSFCMCNRALRTACSTKACCSSGPRARWRASGASSSACSSGRRPRRSARSSASQLCVYYCIDSC